MIGNRCRARGRAGRYHARRGGRRQPWPQGGQELGRVDGLREVVVGPGLDAALAFARHDLAGDGNDGKLGEPPVGPDGADGVVSVHDRHHDVHEDDVDVRRALQNGECLGSALRHDNIGVAPLQQGGKGEDVAEVVVDEEHLHSDDADHLELAQMTLTRGVGVGPVRSGESGRRCGGDDRQMPASAGREPGAR